jgi:hypothetical protein
MRVTPNRPIALTTALLGLAAVACSASSRTPDPIDCNAGVAYELSAPLRTFEVADESWFTGADPTGLPAAPARNAVDPECASGGGGSGGGGATGGAATAGSGGAVSTSASISVAIEPIEGGGRCGSVNAMVLRSAGHNDWGSLFGDWKLASAPGTAFCDTCGPWDATGYEGLAIWARSAATVDSSVTLLLDTWQTSASGTEGVADRAGICKIDCSADSGTNSRDDSGNITSQTYVSPAGTCGNSFQRTLTLTSQWQLYVVPFDSFYQDLKPNMSPNGVDPAHINGLTIRTAKEATVELWVDDIAFYRRK